jgi:hypothetical protein
MLRALADYGQMTLFQLLTRAEIVVSGEIQNVKGETYDLAVDHAFRPLETEKILTVARIDTFRLGTRWADYAEGQKVVVFAVPGATANEPIRPLGVAGEGELPADEAAVYLQSLSRPPKHLQLTSVQGGEQTAYRVGSEEFRSAISGFFECYLPSKELRIARLCEAEALTDYRKSSWLAAHLANIADRLTGEKN